MALLNEYNGIPTMNTGILLIDCPDRKGIVAAVGEYLYRHNANILHADQHQDAERGLFLMRVEWDLAGFDVGLDEFARQFEEIAGRFQMRWRVERSDRPHRVALFVSKYDHCLVDLLYRWRNGMLAIDIPLIVSNHPDCQPVAGRYEIPFLHLPVTPDTKAEQEAQLTGLIEAHAIDLVVLARYMQILSDDVCAFLRGRAINIHHSFLPGFKGARPYHQAHERGVKLIGATAHYVTEALDAGPIIDQDVTRVSHRDEIEDLIGIGRDVERLVLARAVKAHLDDRVLLDGDRTIVF